MLTVTFLVKDKATGHEFTVDVTPRKRDVFLSDPKEWAALWIKERPALSLVSFSYVLAD